MRKPIILTARRATVSRLLKAVFGLFLLGLALAIALSSEERMEFGPLLATIGLGALGIELLTSALLNRRSILSRIGPSR